MVSVSIEKQITVRLPSQFGAVERVVETLADRGVLMHSYSSYHDHRDTVVLVIVTNCGPALQALELAGYRAVCTPVVAVESDYALGVPARLGATLARAGIAVQYSYASSINPAQLLTVFKTVDDERALQVLGDSVAAVAA